MSNTGEAPTRFRPAPEMEAFLTEATHDAQVHRAVGDNPFEGIAVARKAAREGANSEPTDGSPDSVFVGLAAERKAGRSAKSSGYADDRTDAQGFDGIAADRKARRVANAQNDDSIGGSGDDNDDIFEPNEIVEDGKERFAYRDWLDGRFGAYTEEQWDELSIDDQHESRIKSIGESRRGGRALDEANIGESGRGTNTPAKNPVPEDHPNREPYSVPAWMDGEFHDVRTLGLGRTDEPMFQDVSGVPTSVDVKQPTISPDKPDLRLVPDSVSIGDVGADDDLGTPEFLKPRTPATPIGSDSAPVGGSSDRQPVIDEFGHPDFPPLRPSTLARPSISWSGTPEKSRPHQNIKGRLTNRLTAIRAGATQLGHFQLPGAGRERSHNTGEDRNKLITGRRLIGVTAVLAAGTALVLVGQKVGIDINPFDGDGIDLSFWNNHDATPDITPTPRGGSSNANGEALGGRSGSGDSRLNDLTPSQLNDLTPEQLDSFQNMTEQQVEAIQSPEFARLAARSDKLEEFVRNVQPNWSSARVNEQARRLLMDELERASRAS